MARDYIFLVYQVQKKAETVAMEVSDKNQSRLAAYRSSMVLQIAK